MIAVKIIALVALLYTATGEMDSKKSVKRGIDEHGYSLGYNDWASSLKLNHLHSAPLFDRSYVFVPSAHDLSHLVAAAKKAAHEVYLAQQFVNAAKEDVLYSQKLVKEKEAKALIAYQKSESAQHVLRAEAQNVVIAQQKLAKAKTFAAEQQLKQALKDAEAAKAIQSSASNAHSEIQKAEQAAKLSFYKQSLGPHKPYPAPPFNAPWTAPNWNAALFTQNPHQFSAY